MVKNSPGAQVKAGVVETHNHYKGYTQAEYKKVLREREVEIRAAMKGLVREEQELTDKEKEKRIRLEIEQEGVEKKLSNVGESYEKTKELLAESDAKLVELRGQIPEAQIEGARAQLKEGNTALAESLFQQIADDGSKLIAMAAFEKARLAEEGIRYEEADWYYCRAVALDEEEPGFMNTAGEMALRMGGYLRAEPLLESALEMYRKLLGEEHLTVATSLNNLAELYRAQRKYAKSEPLHKQALKIRQTLLDENNPHVAQSLNNLGLLYQDMGIFAKVLTIHHQALGIPRNMLGEEHLDVALSLNNLAALYYDQGECAMALQLVEQSLEIYRKTLPPEHPRIVAGRRGMAMVRSALMDKGN